MSYDKPSDIPHFTQQQPLSQQQAQSQQKARPQQQAYRRNYYRGKGKSQCKLSFTTQLLVDAALDAAGLLCLAGFAKFIDYPLPLPAEALVLLVASVDLLLRNSLRGLARSLVHGLVRQLQALVRCLRVYRRRQRRKGEEGEIPLPEPVMLAPAEGEI